MPWTSLALPFADGHFDLVSVAFGLRNMTHKERALEEMCRVLTDGVFGQVVPDIGTMVEDQISQRSQVLGASADDAQTGAIGLAHLRHACIQ